MAKEVSAGIRSRFPTAANALEIINYSYLFRIGLAVQFMFYSDYCATFYNLEAAKWSTCCPLHVHFIKGPVLFCIPNDAFLHPIPGRKSGAKF